MRHAVPRSDFWQSVQPCCSFISQMLASAPSRCLLPTCFMKASIWDSCLHCMRAVLCSLRHLLFTVRALICFRAWSPQRLVWKMRNRHRSWRLLDPAFLGRRRGVRRSTDSCDTGAARFDLARAVCLGASVIPHSRDSAASGGMARRTGIAQDTNWQCGAFNTRDLIFLTQIAAVLAFVQAQANLHRKRMGLALAAVCGALLPFGIVYSYDRGLYGVAFFGLASIAIASCGGKWGRNWLLGFGAGLAIAAPIVFLIIGNAGLQALIDQVAFWILYGRMIWAFPGLSTISSSWSGVLLIGSFIAMALAAARLYEALMVSRRVGDAVRQELPSLILVAASVASARMAIERGDPGHVAWGTTASWILLSIYIGKFVMDAVGPSPGASRVPAIADSAMPGRPMVFLAMSALIGWNLTLLNPYSAFIALHRGYATSLRTTDKAILSQGQTETVDAMRTRVSDSRCFYTMTNESAWHYLFGKESCSRFYQDHQCEGECDAGGSCGFARGQTPVAHTV